MGWEIAVSSSGRAVAWACGERVEVREGDDVSAYVVSGVAEEAEKKRRREGSSTSGGSSEEVRVSALAWVGARVAVGGTDGVVRVVEKGSDGRWVARYAVAPFGRSRREAIESLSAEASGGMWCRSRRWVRCYCENGGFGARRGIPSEARAAVAGGSALVVVGSKPSVSVRRYAGREGRSSSLLRGVAGAVWGAFFTEPTSSGEAIVDGASVPLWEEADDDEETPCEKTSVVDDGRTGTSVATSACGRLAAVGDDLGRVLLVDVGLGRLVRVFKGIRAASCAFGGSSTLAVLVERRGIVRVFKMRFGGVLATLELSNAKAEWRLCTAGDAICVAARTEDGPPRVAALPPLGNDDREDDQGTYYATGADAKAARAVRASRRAKDAAGALAAFAKIGDAARRAEALDEAARSDDAVLSALVGAAAADPALAERAGLLSRTIDARAKLVCLSGDDADGVAAVASDATTEALAWLGLGGDRRYDDVDADAAARIDKGAEESRVTEAVAAALEAEAETARKRRDANLPPSAATLARGVAVWKAVAGGATIQRALDGTTFASSLPPRGPASGDGAACASALREAASDAAALIFGAALRGDVFGLRDLAAAEAALGLSRLERCRACWSWFSCLDAATARTARAAPALARWFRDDVFGDDHREASEVTSAIVAQRLETRRPAHALAFASAALEVLERRAETLENKTYGDVTRADWGLDALAVAVDQLRISAVLQLGPPRCAEATVANLDAETVLVSDILAADAAAAPPGASPDSLLDGAVGLGDDLEKTLATAALERQDRGWLHAAFPDLDPDALRCLHALASLDRHLNTLSFAANELAAVFARAHPRLHPLVLAAAAAVWRRAAAPALLDAMRPPPPDLPLPHEDSPLDDESASAALVVDAAAALVDLFDRAHQRGLLDPALVDDNAVADLIRAGGSRARPSSWPTPRLGA